MEFKEIQKLFTIDFPNNNAKELIAIENQKYNNTWHPETLYARLNALDGVECVDYDTNLCFSINSEKDTPATRQKILDIFQDVLKNNNLILIEE